MKNSQKCPKCLETEIIRIPGKYFRSGDYNSNPIIVNTGMVFVLKYVHPVRYMCGKCGYLEEWIDNPEDIEKVRQKFGV